MGDDVSSVVFIHFIFLPIAFLPFAPHQKKKTKQRNPSCLFPPFFFAFASVSQSFIIIIVIIIIIIVVVVSLGCLSLGTALKTQNI